MLLARVKRRLIVLTEKTMFDVCRREVDKGRMPREVEFYYAPAPIRLRESLLQSRRRASEEVSPQQP